MLREELDELDNIIRDLRMAKDIKEQIDAGELRGLIDFADGESIKVPIPAAIKVQLDSKIKQLETLLKQKANELTLEKHP